MTHTVKAAGGCIIETLFKTLAAVTKMVLCDSCEDEVIPMCIFLLRFFLSELCCDSVSSFL